MPPTIHGERIESPEYQGANDYIEGNPTIPDQFINSFIDEKCENAQLSSNYCQYRNADINVNVRNSMATIVSHPQFRIECERESSRISYIMVTRLSSEKTKTKIKQKSH